MFFLIKIEKKIESLFPCTNGSSIFSFLQTMFYVTEASFSKSQLLFYHKPIWHKLKRIGAKKLQDAGIIQPITEAVAMEMMRSQKSLGCSKLRFVPKKRGLRPIVRMGKSSISSKEVI